LFEVYSWFGIEEGIVILYTKQVIQAIMAQKKTFIMWLTLEKHKKVHDRFENLEELKNVIEAVDRTHILMKNTLNKDSEVYFTWKKCYAIHC